MKRVCYTWIMRLTENVRPSGTALLAFVLFCLYLGPRPPQVQALEPMGLVVRAGIIAILEDNGLEGDPSPILPSPGIGLSVPLGPFHFEPGLDMYATYYGYSDNLERSVPYAIENRSALVIGSVLNLPVEFGLSMAGLFGLRIFAGPSADLRLCIAADGLEGADLKEATDETAKIAAYFWSSGRWLFGMAGAGVDLPVSGRITLGIDGRTWYPAYRLWSGENLPPAENVRFALTIRVLYR